MNTGPTPGRTPAVNPVKFGVAKPGDPRYTAAGANAWGAGVLALAKGAPAAGLVGQLQGSGQAPQPQNPSQPPAPPAASGSGGGSPLDATYYGNVAANNLRTGNQVNALNLEGSQASTALQQALGQLSYQQPRDQLALEQRFNWGGRDINSTPYAQAQGDLARTYADKQTGAQTTYSDTAARLASQIGGIQAGVPIFNAQEANASAIRASDAAAKNAALGAPPPAAPQPPAAPASRSGRVSPALASWGQGIVDTLNRMPGPKLAPGPISRSALKGKRR